MAFTVDWVNKIVMSDASITDIPATRTALRALEDSTTGMLHPEIISYSTVDLGSGAIFPAIEFINGYQLQFPTAGNYVIRGGNLKATIVPTSGVYVQQTQSAAYAVTAEGGGGSTITVEDIRFEMDNNSQISKVLKNKTVTNPSTGVMTVYANDDATPLLTAQLYEDAAGTQKYRGQGAERRERLV